MADLFDINDHFWPLHMAPLSALQASDMGEAAVVI